MPSMNLKPLSNHLFIEPIDEEKTTKSGIVLPETAEKEKPVKGKIIAVGPGKLNEKGERIPMSVKVGDVVLFKKYGPDEIEINDKKYLVGDEEDILAILE
jgi:chaperonin GroES